MDTGCIATALQDAAAQSWALMQTRAPAVSALIADAMMGKDMTGKGLAKIFAANGPMRAGRHIEQVRTKDGLTAIVPISGLLLYDLDFQPFATSTRKLAADIQTLAADSSIDRIVLDIASSGGVVTGIPEAAAAIFAARKIKPVTAIANPFAGSAAYWLGAMASEFAVIPSGEVGSIGVFVMHLDQSEALRKAGLNVTFIKSKSSPRKTDGNSFEPLAPDAEALIQRDVDLVAAKFVADVAAGRGVSPSTVRADYGRGRMLMAADALQAAMVDRLATIEEVLAGRASSARQTGPRGAGLSHSPPRSARDGLDDLRRLAIENDLELLKIHKAEIAQGQGKREMNDPIPPKGTKAQNEHRRQFLKRRLEYLAQ